MDDSIRHHHLRIKQRLPADLPMQKPTMPIRPVDHRRDGEDFLSATILIFHGFPKLRKNVGPVSQHPSQVRFYHEYALESIEWRYGIVPYAAPRQTELQRQSELIGAQNATEIAQMN
ncbi:hypothetical protein [Rhizobium tumorigenes]|uniref:Uncharacterized protein n=1 Tax=Rhizobium tumorigenes TaxID=2041385 RepID=A0AAF1K7A7_9HYPH|nr:hypothetical protein [Rhizobium tumorigenes]WFR97462.1 hypothetical protein PR017_08440 [Rhizobium tumorigenes]